MTLGLAALLAAIGIIGYLTLLGIFHVAGECIANVVIIWKQHKEYRNGIDA